MYLIEEHEIFVYAVLRDSKGDLIDPAFMDLGMLHTQNRRLNRPNNPAAGCRYRCLYMAVMRWNDGHEVIGIYAGYDTHVGYDTCACYHDQTVERPSACRNGFNNAP